MATNAVFSQHINTNIDKISTILETVEASKTTYSQDLNLTSTNYTNYHLNKLDSKGNNEEIVYSFSFSDIDINTVRTITKKDIILVQLLIKGKQKLIKESSNSGDKVKYLDHLFFYAKNIDNGRILVEHIKQIIPINETLEKNKLALVTYNDHENWLKANIKSVDFIKTQVVQKIDIGSSNNGYFKLGCTTNSKSKTTIYEYEFNLATLNPNSLIFKINGDEFYIEVTNRRNIKAIKEFKDGVQQNYTNKIKFYSSSIENAKDTYRVLKQIIPLAENAFLKAKPNINSTKNAFSYIKKTIKNVSINDITFSQSIEGNCVSEINIKEINPKESIEKKFSFNFKDINIDNIDYNSIKNQLYVQVITKKTAKFIRYIKNNELQNYTNSFNLYVNSIEEAMIVKEALQNIINNCEDIKSNLNFKSIPNSLEFLKREIKLVKVAENNYDQSIDVINTSPFVIKLTTIFSNLKNSKEIINEFGLNDINSKNISIVTSGKYVTVELNTKHLEKIIKNYQDGNIKSYTHKTEIQCTDIENARQIVYTLRNITQNLE